MINKLYEIFKTFYPVEVRHELFTRHYSLSVRRSDNLGLFLILEPKRLVNLLKIAKDSLDDSRRLKCTDG